MKKIICTIIFTITCFLMNGQTVDWEQYYNESPYFQEKDTEPRWESKTIVHLSDFGVVKTKEEFNNNTLRFDTGVCLGGSASYGGNVYVSQDITIRNFMIGLGFCPVDSYHYNGPKTVYVHSYTRKDGTKVGSYYRSRPNSGGTVVDTEVAEMYLGYWSPCLHIKKSIFYATPIIGVGEFDGYAKFLWGGGFKISFKSLIFDRFCLTFKSTNLSTSFGFSWGFVK